MTAALILSMTFFSTASVAVSLADVHVPHFQLATF